MPEPTASAAQRPEGLLTVPPARHVCTLPQVRYSTVLPYEDNEPPVPTEWDDLPPLGSVYACPCGQHWEVVEPQRLIGIETCVNRWVRVSGRRYRRVMKRVAAVANDDARLEPAVADNAAYRPSMKRTTLDVKLAEVLREHRDSTLTDGELAALIVMRTIEHDREWSRFNSASVNADLGAEADRG